VLDPVSGQLELKLTGLFQQPQLNAAARSDLLTANRRAA